MRKVPLYVIALAVIAACAITGCQNSSSGGPAADSGSTIVTVAPADNTSGDSGSPAADSGSPAADSGSTSTATGLFAYGPQDLQPNCQNTGTSGHLPASVFGYTDSLTCNLGGSTPAEVDYYQYGSTSDMQAAYSSASADDSVDAPQQPGGCAGGDNEYGVWSIGGSAIRDIACPSNWNNGVGLIWDDTNTNIIAVISADYATPADKYSWWQSNGASIDGSSQGATSS